MADDENHNPTTTVLLSDSLFRAGPATMLKGYKAAVDRYLEAAQQDTDFGATFRPLFEALNWAVSTRDLLKSEGRPVRSRLANALGFARDRVHHDWAGALQPRRFPVAATAPIAPGYSLTLSGHSVEWFWKPVEELPPPSGGRQKDEKAYRDLLAGRPAYGTLMELYALFEQHIRPEH
jgi:hypothetical protein